MGSQKKSGRYGASVARVTGATLGGSTHRQFLSASYRDERRVVDIVSNSATPGGGGQIPDPGNRSMATSSYNQYKRLVWAMRIPSLR